MAKRTVVIPQELEEALGINGQEEEDFETFLTDVGPQTSVIEIFRMLRDGNREQLERVSFDVIREDAYGYIRETHGPGKYQLVFKDAQKRYKGAKTLNVGGKIVSAVDKPNGNGDMMRELMLHQQQRADQMQQLLIAAISNNRPQALDMGAMMQGFAALMASIIGAAPKHDPALMIKAMAETMNALKPAVREDPIEFATKIMELSRAMADGGNNTKEDTFWSFAKDVGKEVVGRVATGALGAAPNPPQVPAQAESPVEGEPKVQLRPQPTIQDLVKFGLAYLKSKAIRGKDALFYVDTVMENDEEPQWNAIITAIQRGATFEHLLQFDPEIAQDAQLKAWFGILYDGLHSEIFQSVDSTGASGNGDNPTDDEKASEGKLSVASDPEASAVGS